MRRALAGVAVLMLFVVGLVIAGRDTPVEEVSLTVEVSSPAGDPSVTLDAGLYQADGATLPAPALLLAHGFGSDRSSLDEAARAWAREGYVVLTWSARGFGASGGTIGLNDPDREIADGLAEVARFSTTEAPFGVPASTSRRPFAPLGNPPPGSTRNPLQGSRVPFH